MNVSGVLVRLSVYVTLGNVEGATPVEEECGVFHPGTEGELVPTQADVPAMYCVDQVSVTGVGTPAVTEIGVALSDTAGVDTPEVVTVTESVTLAEPSLGVHWIVYVIGPMICMALLPAVGSEVEFQSVVVVPVVVHDAVPVDVQESVAGLPTANETGPSVAAPLDGVILRSTVALPAGRSSIVPTNCNQPMFIEPQA